MIEELIFWSWEIFLVAALLAFVFIIRREGARYILYGAFGSLLGFIFDSTAVFYGYYEFLLPFRFFFGIPAGIIIAEAFSMVIAIYLFEKLIMPHVERLGEKELEDGLAVGD